jgi:hypothetical protein
VPVSDKQDFDAIRRVVVAAQAEKVAEDEA